MRKTLTYVVSLLVCLGLVGSVWAVKPVGKKPKGSTIPVTIQFRDQDCDANFAGIDRICSDGLGLYDDGKDNVQAAIGGKDGPGSLIFSTPKPHKKPLVRPLFFDLRPFCVTGDCSQLPLPFDQDGTAFTGFTRFIEPRTTCVVEPCGFLTMPTPTPGNDSIITMQALFSIRGDENVARLGFRSNDEGFCGITTQDVQVQLLGVNDGKKQWEILAELDLAALCVPILPNGPINRIKEDGERMSFKATVTEK